MNKRERREERVCTGFLAWGRVEAEVEREAGGEEGAEPGPREGREGEEREERRSEGGVERRMRKREKRKRKINLTGREGRTAVDVVRHNERRS